MNDRPATLDCLRGWRAGVTLSVLIGVLGISTLVFMLGVQFSSKEAALLWHLGVGALISGGGAMYAAWSRSWTARILLLLECFVFFWASFLGGVGAWFTTWQSMPNAPDDAYNDTGIFGAVVIGWIPAALMVSGAFLATRFIHKRRTASGLLDQNE